MSFLPALLLLFTAQSSNETVSTSQEEDVKLLVVAVVAEVWSFLQQAFLCVDREKQFFSAQS